MKNSPIDEDDVVIAEEEPRSRRNMLLASATGLAGIFLAARMVKAQTTAESQSSELKGVNVEPKLNKKMTAAIVSDKARPAAGVFARSAADEAVWKSLKAKIRSDLKPTTDGTFNGGLSLFARSITSGLKIQANPGQFSSLHVEPLIDQAADLLDRGVRDRASWDDLAVKWVNLNLEMNEYADLEEIHREEEQSGLYDFPFQQSVAALNAEVAYADGLSYNEYLLNSWTENLYGGTNWYDYVNAHAKAGWLGGCLPWSFNGQSFGGYVSHTYAGDTQTTAKHGFAAGATTAKHQFNEGLAAMKIQIDSTSTLRETSQRRLSGLSAKSDWDRKNASFQRRRTVVARRYQDIKAKAAADVDGLLNYQKRLLPLKDRFQEDFNHALSRLAIVQDGLIAIYGYDGPPLPKDTAAIDYFDRCLLWTRNAIQWLIRFSRIDQNVVIPVSLRALLGKDAYRDARKVKSWAFNLDASFFAGMKHIRIRGLSAYAVKEATDDPRIWRFVVQVPTSGTFSHLSGQNKTVDQSKIPPCRLYRVAYRSDPRESDIAGATALFNASPVGTWLVKLDGAIPVGDDYGDLHDIHLDLHLAYRDEQSKG